MDEDQKFNVAINEFDKAFESARFFQNYHLSAFSYFIAISGGGIALLSANIGASSYATLFSLLLLAGSLAFYLYNRRIERHMVAYYDLSRKLETNLGMVNLLHTQETLQVRLIGFTHVIRAFYLSSVLLWFGLTIFHCANWLHFL